MTKNYTWMWWKVLYQERCLVLTPSEERSSEGGLHFTLSEEDSSVNVFDSHWPLVSAEQMGKCSLVCRRVMWFGHTMIHFTDASIYTNIISLKHYILVFITAIIVLCFHWVIELPVKRLKRLVWQRGKCSLFLAWLYFILWFRDETIET